MSMYYVLLCNSLSKDIYITHMLHLFLSTSKVHFSNSNLVYSLQKKLRNYEEQFIVREHHFASQLKTAGLFLFFFNSLQITITP